MTSNQMAAEVQTLGLKIGPEAVRQWWSKGASKEDASAFLAFYRANRMSNKAEPLAEQQASDPNDIGWRLILATKGILGHSPREMSKHVVAAYADLDAKAEAAGLGIVPPGVENMLTLLLASAIEHTRRAAVLACELAAMLRYHKLDGNIQPPASAIEVERMLNGETFDLEAALKFLDYDPEDFKKPKARKQG